MEETELSLRCELFYSDSAPKFLANPVPFQSVKKTVGGKVTVRNQSTSMKSPKSSGRKIGGGINKKRNVGKGRAVTKVRCLLVSPRFCGLKTTLV